MFGFLFTVSIFFTYLLINFLIGWKVYRIGVALPTAKFLVFLSFGSLRITRLYTKDSEGKSLKEFLSVLEKQNIKYLLLNGNNLCQVDESKKYPEYWAYWTILISNNNYNYLKLTQIKFLIR